MTSMTRHPVFLCTVFVASCMWVFVACRLQPPPEARSLPASDNDFVQLPFRKLINPAFIDEVQGRWLRTEAVFGGVMDVMIDLPNEFRSGYVRFNLYDPDAPTGMVSVVIAKDKSDAVFSLKNGTRVRVFGFCKPTVKTYHASGRSERSFVLIVEKVEPLN